MTRHTKRNPGEQRRSTGALTKAGRALTRLVFEESQVAQRVAESEDDYHTRVWERAQMDGVEVFVARNGETQNDYIERFLRLGRVRLQRIPQTRAHANV